MIDEGIEKLLGEKLSCDIIQGFEPNDPETAPEKKQQGQRTPRNNNDRKPNPNSGAAKPKRNNHSADIDTNSNNTSSLTDTAFSESSLLVQSSCYTKFKADSETNLLHLMWPATMDLQ